MKIALDPGHGARGTGAVGKIDEAVQAWKLTGYVEKYLKSMGYGTYIVRTQNERPELDERAKRAIGCDALISIHFNAGGGDGAEAFPQFYGDKNICAKSKLLAESVINKIKANGQKSRGVKYQPNSTNNREFYGIIYYSRMVGVPAILLEVAFVDTKDALDFDTDMELDKWGKVIAEGIATAYPVADPIVNYTISITGTATKKNAEVLLNRLRTAGFPATIKY